MLNSSHTRHGPEADSKPIRSLPQLDVIIAKPLLLYYAGAIKLLNLSFRSAQVRVRSSFWVSIRVRVRLRPRVRVRVRVRC